MGHPAKEGLRLIIGKSPNFSEKPRVGHPAKEGLRPAFEASIKLTTANPEWVIQQKRD